MRIRLIWTMKYGNLIRWILAVLMLLALPLAISSPALADVTPLPLDMTTVGNKWDPDGWISQWEYQDESIHAVLESRSRKNKSSTNEVKTRWVVIEIADPTQLRTRMTNDSYGDQALQMPSGMVKSANAVVAINGDFVKYSYDFGYVIRQGVFYRDMLDSQKYPRDVLVIDDAGDFSVVQAASGASMAAFMEELEASGRKAINTFTFGPALIIGGEVQEVSKSPEFEAILANQRICLCQLDTLKYAIVQVDGDSPRGDGINLQELANYVKELFPECRVAYNLDGGASTYLFMHNKLVNQDNGRRTISDIVYFASAAGE